MDSTSFFRAMLAFLNNPVAGPIPVINYPGTPQVFTVIPAAPLTKYKKEKERRDKINKKFADLQNLVAKDSNKRMSQTQILRAALETVVKIKRESSADPQLQGLNDAVEKIEHLAIFYLKSVKGTIHVQTLKEMLAMFRDIIITGRPTITSTIAPKNPPATFTPAAANARKETKKHREQGRRNMQTDGYGALREFIAENKLVPRWSQKLQVLEAIIAYIQNKPVNRPSQRGNAQYLIGFEQGKHLAINAVTAYFKSNLHLFIHIAALHNFMYPKLGPLDYSIKTADVKLDPIALQKFFTCYPNLLIRQTHLNSVIAPPAPRMIPGSIFRPWE
ncbi:hypothetical protein CAEBREN_13327 [Caenorhabditis brenneri]|uniref:BHLH domain-containing protein n=1 Tax=Caenorhabditis brenneri TaxID=135651 RepID=G0M9T0_CAEBE|nr:hypothetical protein CAEBREN_13327 [Caenorhabditis brenneri]